MRPFSTFKDPRSTPHEPKATRYVPPSGFDYPLDGLLPRIPGRFFFTPAALLGFSPSKVSSSERFHGLSAGKNPLTVSVAVSSGTEAPNRPAKPRFLGSRLSEVPCDRGFLSQRSPAPPLGFAPPGLATTALTRISPSLLSHASRVLAITRRIRRRLRVSIGCRFASTNARRNKHRPKPPSWGFCTCLILSIRACRCLGYSLHLAPGRALLPAHRCSWGIVAPCRSCSGSEIGRAHV